MSLRDVLSPKLAADPRLRSRQPELRRVFSTDLHEVFLALYPGLVAALVHYRRESLRLMILVREDDSPPADSEARLARTVEALRLQGKSPHHLILEAKLECGQTLSLHDRAALKLAGVEIPRSAGRYKDLFGESS